MADARDEDPLEKEAAERKKAARQWKELWGLDFKEAYFFAAPHRQRQIYSTSPPPTQRLLDSAELNTALAFLDVGDFVTEIVNTYMPEAQNWCERGPGMFVPPDAYKQIADAVRAQDAQIFEAIRASNLYSELPKAFNPDLAIGTTAMWIDRRRAHLPIECLAVPLRELECNLGPDGLIDDRFVIRYTPNKYVTALLPKDAVIDDELQKTIKNKPTERTEISWGFWRLWDEEDETWQAVVMVQDKLVHKTQLVGEGSCPLLVGRFNPSADWVWGIGPLMQGLPDFRQIDELEANKIEHTDRVINPSITYPNDSFSNVENGFESGMAYPITPGTEGAVKAIYQPPPADAANYQYEGMEHRLRKLFYIDYPEQTGDTPPTLGQWLDEMARAQRRIGTPGLPFWREVCAPVFLRFKYLLEKAMVIPQIKVDGRAVSLRPYNPTQRAAEQQEIATAAQFAQMAAQMFPEEWKMQIDGRATMMAFMKKMRVGDLIILRDQNDVQAFMKQMAPMLQQHLQAGAPQPPPGAGAPAGSPGAPPA
jgi:hypothetical protein